MAYFFRETIPKCPKKFKQTIFYKVHIEMPFLFFIKSLQCGSKLKKDFVTKSTLKWVENLVTVLLKVDKL